MREAPWLDREYVQTASAVMRQYGMSVPDSVSAACAGSCMLALDRACMPAGVPPVIVEYTTRRHNIIIARCHHKVVGRPKLREHYEIFIPDFHARMERECEANLLLRGNQLDISTMVMALAGHEVRHRLQRRSAIGQFAPFCKPGADILLRAVVDVLSQTFKENKEILAKTEKGKTLLRMLHSNEEFDARVIERMIMRRGPKCTTVDDLAHLVLLEPTL